MVKLVAALAVLVMLWAEGALAEAAETPLARAMKGNPARFEARMLDLVAGFGGPSGLTREGIGEHIALERAGARASAMRRLLGMDLNGDGSVARDELGVAQRAASAKTRGRMERQVAEADTDGNSTVDPAEIRAEGQASALRALGTDEEALLLSLLTLDADSDGALSADELRGAMTRSDDGG